MTYANWIELVYAAINVIVGLVPTHAYRLAVIGPVLSILGRLAALTPPDARGTFKMPFAPVSLTITRLPLPVLLVLLTGCAGSLPGTATGPPPWVRTASHALGLVRSATHAAVAVIRSNQLTTEQQTHAVATVETIDLLAAASLDALRTYETTLTTDDRCRCYAALRGVGLTLLSLDQELRAAGVRVPPVTTVLLGALTGVVDTIQPGCSPGDPSEIERASAAMQGLEVMP